MLADNSEKGAKSPKSQTGGGHQDNIELIFANGTIFHSPATSLSRERSEPAALPLSSEVSARRHASSSFSRTWLETRLGLSDDERLMALEAREDLPPLIMRSDLLLVDRGVKEAPAPGRSPRAIGCPRPRHQTDPRPARSAVPCLGPRSFRARERTRCRPAHRW